LISNCNLSNNICTAPLGYFGKSAGAFGGALFQESGSVTFTNSTLAFNGAFGKDANAAYPARPSAAYGGAIAVSSGAATLTRCTLISKLARGGDAFHFSGTGEAQGGAIYSSATFTASESTFAGNQALSGSLSNTNTDGRGGAIYNSGLAVLNGCSLISN